MRFSVIGVGYLGAAHATAMVSIGFEVIAIDIDAKKIESLPSGTPSFYEPGFPDLLTETMNTGRLAWSPDIADASHCDVHLVCVGTPQLAESNGADLQCVDAESPALIPHLKPCSVVAGKSAVPAGTAVRLCDEIARRWPGTGPEPLLVWNPEFLREGFAVQDTLRPDRIVVGVPNGEGGVRGERALREVYREMLAADLPMIVPDLSTAELVKAAANAVLATKISFINALAEVCEAVGGDVTVLAEAIGHDARIGSKFLGAGVGFGGGCLPRQPLGPTQPANLRPILHCDHTPHRRGSGSQFDRVVSIDGRNSS